MAPRASRATERCCTDCGEIKPVAEFHGKGLAKDGTQKYQSYCRKCANKRRAARGTSPEVVRRASQKHREAHRETLAQRQRERRLANPQLKVADADRHLWRKYGITRDEWEQMFAQQGGACAICGVPLQPGPRVRTDPVMDKVCVDHCHDTGMVRGLLCDPCNKGLGSFRDNPDLLANAIKYLTQERPPT
jgi:hypothetical protein